MTLKQIHVVHCIARMNAGGTATLLHALMSQVDTHVRQTLVFGKCESEEIDFFSGGFPPYDYRYIPTLRRAIRPLNEIRSFIALRKYLKESRPDILHTHTFKAGLIGRAVGISLLRRPKVVHTFHGHLLTGYFSPPITWIIRTLERVLARATDVLLAVSSQVRADLQAAGIGVSRRFEVILPGIAEPRPIEKQVARYQLGLSSDLFTVTFLGRLTRVKRIDRFLNALNLLRMPYQAVVAGDGEESSEAKRLAEQLGVNAQFLGWQDDVERVFAASDVVVLTSENEGLGLVLVEAQLRGIPVVGTDVGSVSLALLDGSTGFLVHPSAGDVARGIEKIAQFSDAQRTEISERAKEFAGQNFSFSRFSRDHFSLYLEILSTNTNAMPIASKADGLSPRS